MSTPSAGIFRDDFEDGDFEGWQVFNGPQPVATVVDGKFQVESHFSISVFFIVGDDTWKDYEIEFDVKPLENFSGDIDVMARLLPSGGAPSSRDLFFLVGNWDGLVTAC